MATLLMVESPFSASGGRMSFLLSNTMIKILVFAAFACLVAAGYEQNQSGDVACSTISNYPGRSSVYECPAGLSTVALHAANPTYATVSTDIQTEAWLTAIGDSETKKTLEAGKIGAPVVLGPGSFMAVGTGQGLVYITSKQRFLVTVAWDVPHN